MKKLTVILLAALFFCLSPAYAATTEQNSGITWSVDGTTLTISGEGAIPDYADPGYNFNNEPIAPWYGMNIEKVIIEEGVTRIGDYAFFNMKSVTSVEIPGSVSSVGRYAFFDNNITQIVFPGSIHLEDSVFAGCYNLHSVTFQGPASIDALVFSENYDLTALYFPDQSASIGYWGFRSSSLKAVWIPADTKVSPGAFYMTADIHGNYPFRDLTVYGEKGSSAEKGCEEIGIPFVARAETPSLTFFRGQAKYPAGKFQDIAASQEPVVKTVYELGIMNGQSDSRFAPSGSLTVAEAVKMAAMVHNTYNGFQGVFPVRAQGAAWYQPYVDYCVALGIMTGTEFDDYNQPATRAQMAYLFANALPEQELAEISDMSAFPDVTDQTAYFESILALQKAGIVIGDEKGYRPNDTISRLEAAIIISREAVPDMRVS